MSNLLHHADREFKILLERVRADSPDDRSAVVMQEQMHAGLRNALEVISEQGHSGFSMSTFTSMLAKLVSFEPLSPITGEDSEWVNVSELSGEPLWQNSRCSHVFKDEHGRAFDTNGLIAVEENGCTYTGNYSHQYISFPYVPMRSYITHPDDEHRFQKAGLDLNLKNFKTAEEAHGAYAILLEHERNAGQDTDGK